MYLVTNEGIALSRDNILDNVWGMTTMEIYVQLTLTLKDFVKSC